MAKTDKLSTAAMLQEIAKLKGITRAKAQELMVKVAYSRLRALAKYSKRAPKRSTPKRSAPKRAAKKVTKRATPLSVVRPAAAPAPAATATA